MGIHDIFGPSFALDAILGHYSAIIIFGNSEPDNHLTLLDRALNHPIARKHTLHLSYPLTKSDPMHGLSVVYLEFISGTQEPSKNLN